MNANWKDTSTWSSSDYDGSEPKEWTFQAGPVRVVVHRYVGCGDEWFVSMYAKDTKRTGTSDVMEAKRLASAMLHGFLRQAYDIKLPDSQDVT